MTATTFSAAERPLGKSGLRVPPMAVRVEPARADGSGVLIAAQGDPLP